MAERVIDTLVTEFLYRTDADKLKGLDSQLGKVQSSLRSASGIFIGLGTTALGVFATAAKAAIDWEEAFTGVKKTVTATDEELAVIEARLRQMAREEIPISHEELASIAEAAGQLGIETKNIEGFTEVMAKLGVTTNLTAQDAATQTARFANIVSMSQEDFDRLGATVVDLGNNMATTEAEIVAMGLRLAGAGKLVDLSEAQILAYSGALSSVGLEAEAGGTAFSRVWAEMQAAVKGNTKELKTFAKVSGVAQDEFRYIFGRDASDATIRFLDGLKRMVDAGENVHEVLAEIGFDNVRIRDSLLRTSSAGDLVTDALARADTAWQENSALTKEAELRFGTLRSQLTFLKNNLYDLRIEIGDALTPTLAPLIEKVRDALNVTREWVRENPRLVAGLAAVSAGLLALGFALFGASIAIGVLRSAVGMWAWLLESGAFVTLGNLAQATFLRMSVWGTAAAAAVNRAWARTFLTFKFGGLAASASQAFGVIRHAGHAALHFVAHEASLAFHGIKHAGVGAMHAIKVAAATTWTVLTMGTFWILVAAAAAIVAAWKPVSTLFKGLWEGFKSQFGAIREAIAGFLDQLGPLGDGVRKVGTSIVNLFGDWSKRGRVWGEAIGRTIVTIIEALSVLGVVIRPLFSIVSFVFTAIFGVLGWFVKQVKAFAVAVDGILLSVFRGIWSFFEGFVVGVSGRVTRESRDTIDSLVGSYTEFQKRITEAFIALRDFLWDTSTRLFEVFGVVDKSFKDLDPGDMESWREWGRIVGELAGGPILEMLKVLSKVFDFFNLIAGIAIDTFDGIAMFVRLLIEEIKKLKPVWDAVKSGFMDGLDQFKAYIDAFKSAIDKILELIAKARESDFGQFLFGDPDDYTHIPGVDFDGPRAWEPQPTEGGKARRGGDDLSFIPGVDFRQPAAWLPAAASGAYASGFYHQPPASAVPPSQPTTQTDNRRQIRIERLEVTAPPGSDPEEVAAVVEQKLTEKLSNTAEDFDDDFEI